MLVSGKVSSEKLRRLIVLLNITAENKLCPFLTLTLAITATRYCNTEVSSFSSGGFITAYVHGPDPPYLPTLQVRDHLKLLFTSNVNDYDAKNFQVFLQCFSLSFGLLLTLTQSLFTKKKGRTGTPLDIKTLANKRLR